MFGVDDLMMAAVIASIASAGMQYKASTDAASRAAEETRRSLANQAELQKQAEARAMEQAQEFNTEDRAEKQEELTEQLTESFYKPVESAQAMNALDATVEGNVSSDYLAAKANSDANQVRMAKQLAELLGKQAGANQLRENEALSIATAGSDIDRLSSFSRGQAAADQLAINSAANSGAELKLLGSVVGSVGQIAGMAGTAMAAKEAAAAAAKATATAAAQGAAAGAAGAAGAVRSVGSDLIWAPFR